MTSPQLSRQTLQPPGDGVLSSPVSGLGRLEGTVSGCLKAVRPSERAECVLLWMGRASSLPSKMKVRRGVLGV